MAEAEEYELQRIDERVAKIPLPLPLDDLPLVNCYLIAGDDGLTLVDPGWKSPDTMAALTTHLGTLGFRPSDVRRVLVTHSHWDHYTQALDLRARYGATVFLGRPERTTIDTFDPSVGDYPAQMELLRRAGASQLADAVNTVLRKDYELDMPFEHADVWLDDGARIDCGGMTLVAHATPGHTRGHVVYTLDGLAFTGDHILPRITPSLAFEQAPEEQPLASYRASLQSFVDGADRTMLPAHGTVGASVRDRAAELLAHHDHRLKLIYDHVVAGAGTAAEIAGLMTWTRHGKTIEQLGTVHAMTAVLEVRSHLEHLVLTGRLAKRHGRPESYRVP